MKINIFDFLPQKDIILKLNDSTRQNLFSNFNMPLTALSEKTKIHIKNLSRYRNGSRGIPLMSFLKLISLANLDIDYFQNKISLKLTKEGTDVKIGPFLEITPEWVYFSELIRGDGHITPNFWTVYIVNKEKKLINIAIKFFHDVGVPKERMTLFVNNGVYSLNIRSKILAYLLYSIFRIPPGKKFETNIQSFIYENKSFVTAAIGGAFDAEGTVQIGSSNYTTPRRIVIASISKNWLLDLQRLLKILSIESCIKKEIRKSYKPIYRLYVTHQKNLKRFYDTVKINHPKRKNKLNKLLKTFNQNRHPEGDLRIKVFEAIKDGKVKRSEIINHLNISNSSAGWQLKWLLEHGFIKISKKITTNNGSYYIYKINNQTNFGLLERYKGKGKGLKG